MAVKTSHQFYGGFPLCSSGKFMELFEFFHKEILADLTNESKLEKS